MEKDDRIKAEISRLLKNYKDLPENKRTLALPLIERSAFMKIELEDLEEFLQKNGWSELFQQSDKVPAYQRARPEGNTYLTLNANYQKITNQLDKMLPNSSADESDELAVFLGKK